MGRHRLLTQGYRRELPAHEAAAHAAPVGGAIVMSLLGGRGGVVGARGDAGGGPAAWSRGQQGRPTPTAASSPSGGGGSAHLLGALAGVAPTQSALGRLRRGREVPRPRPRPLHTESAPMAAAGSRACRAEGAEPTTSACMFLGRSPSSGSAASERCGSAGASAGSRLSVGVARSDRRETESDLGPAGPAPAPCFALLAGMLWLGNPLPNFTRPSTAGPEVPPHDRPASGKAGRTTLGCSDGRRRGGTSGGGKTACPLDPAES